MKISEMTVDQATETMIRIAEPIANICDDEETTALLDEIAEMKEVPVVKLVSKILPKFVAYGLEKHKNDLYEIIGALQMMPTEKVGCMNFAEMIRAMRDSIDNVLTDFFTRSDTAQKSEDDA